jgi:hypothetical protein
VKLIFIEENDLVFSETCLRISSDVIFTCPDVLCPAMIRAEMIRVVKNRILMNFIW